MGFQLLAPCVLICGTPWLPESPRYLIYNDREEAGLAVLKNLHASETCSDDAIALAEFAQISAQVSLDRAHEVSWLALWKKPNTRKRLIYGWLVIAAAQSSGVLVSLMSHVYAATV